MTLTVNSPNFTRFYLGLLMLVAFTIPLPLIYNNIALGLLVIFWLLAGKIKERFTLLLKNKFFWLFSAVYLIQLVGILYSADVGDALTKLEKKAGLVLLPFLLLSLPALTLRQLFAVIWAFALSSFGLVAIAIGQVWAAHGTLLHVPHLTESIDDIIHLHHAYSGLYLVFSICGLVYMLNLCWTEMPGWVRVGTILLVVGLYGVLIILGARMALFISFLVLGLQMVVFTWQTRRLRALLFIAFTALVGLAGVFSLPATRTKLNEILFFKGVYHPFTPRIIQWQCCLEIVDENHAWLQGVGTGDVKPLLQACYQSKKFWGELYHYNSHNEYLEEMLRHGLIGLLILLLALGLPLYLALKHQHYLYGYFLIIFMLACLSEAILNRQKGVIFYAFFNAILFVPVLTSQPKPKSTTPVHRADPPQ